MYWKFLKDILRQRRDSLVMILALTLLTTPLVAGTAQNAEAYAPKTQLISPDLPLFFSATTTFPELYLGQMLGAFLKLAEQPLPTYPLLPSEPHNEETVVQWRLPEESRLAVEKEGDPIPEYTGYNELWHTVKRGETRVRIDEMYKYRSGDLEQLNPGVDLENLNEGDRLLVWRRSPIPSQSSGKANRGRLLHGEPLRPDDAYLILYQHRVFGTQHTVAAINHVISSYGKRYPDAHPLVIGDISMRSGRRIRPHRSHQSGRDVDISYPNIIPPPHYRRFIRTRRKNLDAEKTLDLLKSFIDTGYVEYIFVDRRLQRELIKEAQRQGAPQEWISSVFQYRGKPGAIIRHARGHVNHFHVRFRCTANDLSCRDSFIAKKRAEERRQLAELSKLNEHHHIQHERSPFPAGSVFEITDVEDGEEEEILIEEP